MQARLPLLLIGFLGFVFSIVATVKILEGGFYNQLQLLAILSPAIFIVLLVSRNVWAGLAMGLLVAEFRMPIPLLDRLTVGAVFAGMMILVFMVTVSVRKGNAVTSSKAVDTLMAFCACLVTLRVLYDRPGSARMGESGGIGLAVLFVLAAWSYFAFRWVGREMEGPGRQLKWMAGLAFAATAHYAAIARLGGQMYWGWLFAHQMWLLAAVILAWIMGHRRMRLQWLWFSSFSLVFLMLSFFAGHRSRPMIAIGVIMTVAALRGSFRRLAVWALAGAAALVVIGTALSQTSAASLVARPLSILFPSKLDASYDRGEMGWQSSFRGTLYREAWMRIQDHPVMGQGYKYARSDVLSRLSMISDVDARLATYAITGSYHNSILILAVFNGLPAAICFVVAIILTWSRFAPFVFRLDPSPMKTYGMALCGFGAAILLQMLVNGGEFEFLGSVLILGLMNGVLARQKAGEQAARTAVTVPKIMPAAPVISVTM